MWILEAMEKKILNNKIILTLIIIIINLKDEKIFI